MNIHIQNGTLIDPVSLVEQTLDIWIKAGKIFALGQLPEGCADAFQCIDATGQSIAPGLIDLSARLHVPDGGYTHIQSELCAALAGGVTHVFCLPDLQPVLDEPSLVEMLLYRAQQVRGAHVLPFGALTVGLKGERVVEMVKLTESGCVGFTQAHRPIADTKVLLRTFEYAATYDYPLMLRAQDYYLSKGGVAASGVVATHLGLTEIPEIAETIALNTYFDLAKKTGARLHVSNISSAAGVQVLRQAKAQGLSVTADVGIHHLYLLDTDIGYFDAQYRFNPPLRHEHDRQALRQALKDGILDAICSDHTPVHEDQKRVPFEHAQPGATALELWLALAVRFAQEEDISLAQLWRWLSWHPAQIFGLSSGDFTIGTNANLCIFDTKTTWKVRDLKSYGANTPFLGYELPAKVNYTILNGEMVFDAAQLT